VRAFGKIFVLIRGKDNLSGGAGKNSAGDFKKHSKKAPYKKS